MALPNFVRSDIPRRDALRLEAEAVAKKAALGSFAADYAENGRSYTTAEIAEALEQATAFLAAAEDLAGADDRSMLLSAALARICDAAHFRSHRAATEPAAMQAPARLHRAEDALQRVLGRNPRGLLPSWWFLARSLFRPPQEGAPAQIFLLAALRLAAAHLYLGEMPAFDAPRVRERQS